MFIGPVIRIEQVGTAVKRQSRIMGLRVLNTGWRFPYCNSVILLSPKK